MREHGTYVKYVQDQCRCDDCREANRLYERDRSRRKAPPYVGAARARRHVAWLAAEQGIGLKSVAAASGVSHGTLTKLVRGNYRGRGPSKRVRPETESKILAVHPRQFANRTKEPAAETWANVDELVSRGWTKAAIGRRVHGPNAVALQLGREFVTRRNAATVRGLLDEPVPARVSRWGVCPVEESDDDADLREEARREQQRERRARYRRLERDGGEELEVAPDPLAALRLSVVGDQSWMKHAACRRDDVPTWMFFPGRGDTETLTAAREVCASCPVVEPCGEFATANGEMGVWGGLAESDRRQIRRGRKVAS